jgi:hypothetical protein
LVIYGGRCYKHSANKLVDILSGNVSGVDIYCRFMGVDILSVDISSVDISPVDISSVDILR